jgi:hypothetical protein
MLADFTRAIEGAAADVHVCTLDELLVELGSDSLAVTVAVLVKHVPLVAGAVPVRVMVGDSLAPEGRAPSEHKTVLPVTLQPGVDVATLVTPAGTLSLTAKPELPPGPLLVTARVHVTVPPGVTLAGPDLTMLRSVGRAVQAAPSLVVLDGPE